MAAHGVMFHHFHGAERPTAQGSLTADAFERMLDHLAASFQLLSAEEFLHKAGRGALVDNDLCLTFDDCLRCQYDIAFPVMRRRGLTAFWFLYTSPMQGVVERLELYRYFRNTAFEGVEDFYAYYFDHVLRSRHASRAAAALKAYDPGPMMANFPFYSADDCRFRHLRDDVLGEASYNELMDEILDAKGFRGESLLHTLWLGAKEARELRAAGHVIGLHSHTHPNRLAEFSLPQQALEYAENKRILEDVLGEPITCMSHPTNSYGPETLEILEGMGVRLGFRALMGGGGGGPLELPRKDHAEVLREMK